VARQSTGRERVAVISRTLLRGRPSEDRDIAATIFVEVFDALLAGDYPVLKDLDFGFNRHAGWSTFSANFANAPAVNPSLPQACHRRRRRILDLQPAVGAPGVLLVSVDSFFINQRDQIVALAARHAVPAIYGVREFAAAGGLMCYGLDVADSYRQVGTYAGKILKGAKPADLPVQRVVRVEFVVNLKTAKTLGLTFPITLLGRADEVIE
jgi:hypothetical protein